jgi:hypothetical protein
MKKALSLGLIVIIVLMLAGCVAGPNPQLNKPDDQGNVAGFWQGLWQGFISPFTFIISLFNKNVLIYEVHNNGGWYNFGFIIGVSAIFGGGGGGAARRRRND